MTLMQMAQWIKYKNGQTFHLLILKATKLMKIKKRAFQVITASFILTYFEKADKNE